MHTGTSHVIDSFSRTDPARCRAHPDRRLQPAIAAGRPASPSVDDDLEIDARLEIRQPRHQPFLLTMQRRAETSLRHVRPRAASMSSLELAQPSLDAWQAAARPRPLARVPAATARAAAAGILERLDLHLTRSRTPTHAGAGASGAGDGRDTRSWPIGVRRKAFAPVGPARAGVFFMLCGPALDIKKRNTAP